MPKKKIISEIRPEFHNEIKEELVNPVNVATPLAMQPIQSLALDFGREDLNQLVAKLNEVIKRL